MVLVSNSEPTKEKEDENINRKYLTKLLPKVFRTEGKTMQTGHNAPPREGWTSADPVPYPEEQEE